LVVLLCWAVYASAQIAVAYQANVNVSLANGANLSYRKQTTTLLEFPGLFSGIFLSSLSLGANPTSASIDGVYGSAYAGILTPPSAWLAFYDVAANWNVAIGSGVVNASLNAATGAVAQVFISLDEVPAAGGNAVQTILLRDLVWVGTANTTGNGGLNYITLKGTQLLGFNSFAVYVTFAVSDVVGVLQGPGSPVITPKSFNSFISIQNFPYQSTANSVRLNMGVGTESGSLTATGIANVYGQNTVSSVVSGSGEAASYFTLDSTCQIGAKVTKASVSAWQSGQSSASFDNANLVAQVQAKYGVNAEFKIISVTFTAGATNIMMDPQIGVGSAPPAPASASAGEHLLPSVFLIMLALIKTIFFH